MYMRACFALGLVGTLLLAAAPEILAADESPSTQPITFTGHDFRGKSIDLADFRDNRCVVVAFLGAECPLAKLYAARLQELPSQFPAGTVAVIGINSNAQDRVTKIESFARRHGVTFPIIKDAGNRLADQFGAERTPQVYLLDADRRIRYQGRIDDQYLIGVVRSSPQREDLKLAIEEVIKGVPVSVPQTTAVGCLIGRIQTPDQSSPVTYSREIARIFQDHCVQCHRTGDVAPFTLASYEDVVGWGPMIGEVVKERRMPPWHADPHFGTFKNDSSLSETERQQIATWIEHGCPEGDPQDLPEPRVFTEGWQLWQEPDVVIKMRDEPFEIPADAGPEGVKYQRFWVESGMKEDRWVEGMEIQPGNRAVVHHVIVYVCRNKNKKDGHEFLCAYVPGLRLNRLPEGAAKKIPANSWLQFEVHYTPNGSPQSDMTRLGLIFADAAKVTHEIRTTVVGKQDFVIEPQKSNQEFTAQSGKMPIDVQLIAMAPHMHLRGQAFEFEAAYPDGKREILLKVPHYDFNWQTHYRLAEPLLLPAGTVIHCKAAFDNSTRNLANPDPNATVRWGDQSWEEMFLGYMDIMFPANLPSGDDAQQLAKLRMLAAQLDPGAMLKAIDKNQDGAISREEAAGVKLLSKHFDRVDKDGDGKVSAAELEAVLKAN